MYDASHPSPCRVIVIDDDPAFQKQASRALQAADDLMLTATAANLAGGLQLLEKEPADVLVVDLGLPDGSGIELIHAARRVWRDCEVMVATVFGDEAHVIAAIEAGATGYLLKDSRQTALVDEIRSLRAGGSPISPLIARRLLVRFAAPLRGEPTPNPSSNLSKREEVVLDFVTRGFNQSEVAERLQVSVNTVRTYIRRIYVKLGVRTRSDAIIAARQLGLG